MSCRMVTVEQIREMSAAIRGKVDKLYLHWTATGYHHITGDFHVSIAGPGMDFQDGELIVPDRDFNIMRHHTYGRNRRALGIAFMCGIGATGKDDLGAAPPTLQQVKALSTVVAAISDVLDLPIDRTTVLTHAEAAANLDNPLIPPHVNYGPEIWGGSNERWDLIVVRAGDQAGSGGDVIRYAAVRQQNLLRGFTGAKVWLKEMAYDQKPERQEACVNNMRETNTLRTQVVTDQLMEKERRLVAIQTASSKPAGYENIKIDEVREYLSQAKAILGRNGMWPGEGADIEIVGRMLRQGYPDFCIMKALEAASPMICGAISPLLYAHKILHLALSTAAREKGPALSRAPHL